MAAIFVRMIERRPCTNHQGNDRLVYIVLILCLLIPSHVSSDTTWNDLRLEYHALSSLESFIHCVGENFAADAWRYRSCQYRYLCYDTNKATFHLYESQEERRLRELLSTMPQSAVSISSTMNQSVSRGLRGPEWMPEVVHGSLEPGFYRLDDHMILVPTLSVSESDHALLEFFLPLYNLLSIFDLESQEPVLISVQSLENVVAYLPLFGMTTRNVIAPGARIVDTTGVRSPLVCARYGAAGFGLTADNDDGQVATNMMGRGIQLWAFRNYMLDKLGGQPPVKQQVVVMESSDRALQKHFDALQEATMASESVTVVKVDRNADLSDQVRTVASSRVCVTICGAHTSLALFLPRGATLISYCDDSDVDGTVDRHLSRSDRMMLTSSGYFRSHWIPISSLDGATDDLLQAVWLGLNAYQADQLVASG